MFEDFFVSCFFAKICPRIAYPFRIEPNEPPKGAGVEIALVSLKSNEISILVLFRDVGKDEGLSRSVFT